MVTPVHRFHQVDCVTSQFSASQQLRRNRPSHASPPPYSNGGEGCSDMGRGDTGVYLEPVVGTPPPGGGGPHLEMEMPAAQPLPHHHHSLPVGKLRCSMWASFALATVFVAGAKFYFDHQGTGLEVLVICTVLVVVMYMLAGCTMSVCRSKVHRPPPPTSEGPPNTPVARLELIQVLPDPAPQQQQQQVYSQHQAYGQQQAQIEAPPPPYHIAISLPQCITPPPSYEKAVS